MKRRAFDIEPPGIYGLRHGLARLRTQRLADRQVGWGGPGALSSDVSGQPCCRRLSFRFASGNGSQKDVQFFPNQLPGCVYHVVVTDILQGNPAFGHS